MCRLHEAEGKWDFEKEETFHSYYLNDDTTENLGEAQTRDAIQYTDMSEIFRHI